jgi:8-oxo-dGTP pyrophosphatase MutT (NUDIX family)
MTTLRTTLAMVNAAVLAPVYRAADDRVHLILVRKVPGGPHGGQLAFPGGHREPTDGSLAGTALREAEEEIGLAPSRVALLSDLPLVETATTGFRVAPFLGRLVGPPPVWRRQKSEIAEVLDVAVDELMARGAHDEEIWTTPNWPGPRLVPFYWIGPYKLWGMTYRIVEPLLPRLQAGEWAI